MEVFTNPNYKPKIKSKRIRYLKDDYTLHLKDLNNYRIEYSKDYRNLYVNFDAIYLEFGEELIKIDCIIGSFGKYHFNGYYEQKEWKHIKIKIGEDIINYLENWEIKYLEGKDKKNES